MSLHLSLILQEEAARARSTGFGGGGGVYGVPPTGRKVPDGWQKTGAEYCQNCETLRTPCTLEQSGIQVLWNIIGRMCKIAANFLLRVLKSSDLVGEKNLYLPGSKNLS